MKYMILSFLFFIINGDFNRIAEINRLKKEAQLAYQEKNFTIAAMKYSVLVDSLGQDDDELLMNLAHCYFNLKDTTHAINQYKSLTKVDNKSYQSVAWQQLGILDAESQHFADAEEDFRNALRVNPSNDDARYNYELLKKKLKNKEQKNKNDQNKQQQQNKNKQKQNQQQQNQQNKQQQQQKDQQQKDQNKQEQQNSRQNQDQQKKQEQNQQQGKQDKKNEDKQNHQEAQQQNDQQKNNKENSQQMSNEKFDENKISPEKARMILEAMKNTEEQYLQQLRRKSSKKPDSDEPDW